MARIRTIKPEFWISEQVMECSPIARLMFIGMWNFCDDGGVHPKSAKRIKAAVFPGDESVTLCCVEKMMLELEENGLIEFFDEGGKSYLYITGWTNHQRVDRPSYKYPGPSNPKIRGPFGDHSTNDPRISSDHSPPEGKGREGNVKEVSSSEGKEPDPPGFVEFWESYPKRNGIRIGRKKCVGLWKKIPAPERGSVMIGVKNYAQSKQAMDGYAKDPERWLRDELWKDFIGSTGPPHSNNTTEKAPSVPQDAPKPNKRRLITKRGSGVSELSGRAS